jgi:hypothetical protein
MVVIGGGVCFGAETGVVVAWRVSFVSLLFYNNKYLCGGFTLYSTGEGASSSQRRGWDVGIVERRGLFEIERQVRG